MYAPRAPFMGIKQARHKHRSVAEDRISVRGAHTYAALWLRGKAMRRLVLSEAKPNISGVDVREPGNTQHPMQYPAVIAPYKHAKPS